MSWKDAYAILEEVFEDGQAIEDATFKVYVAIVRAFQALENHEKKVAGSPGEGPR